MGIALYLFCVRLGLLLKNQLHRPYSPVSILFKEPITLFRTFGNGPTKTPFNYRVYVSTHLTPILCPFVYGRVRIETNKQETNLH